MLYSSLGKFRVRYVRTISPTTKLGIFCFLQQVCVTYVPFYQLQVGDFLFPSENFRAHDACTILPTTKWETSQKFLCMRHTYLALSTILGLAQAHPNYHDTTITITYISAMSAKKDSFYYLLF